MLPSDSPPLASGSSHGSDPAASRAAQLATLRSRNQDYSTLLAAVQSKSRKRKGGDMDVSTKLKRARDNRDSLVLEYYKIRASQLAPSKATLSTPLSPDTVSSFRELFPYFPTKDSAQTKEELAAIYGPLRMPGEGLPDFLQRKEDEEEDQLLKLAMSKSGFQGFGLQSWPFRFTSLRSHLATLQEARRVAMQEHEQIPTFHLFTSLPAELRAKIYGYALQLPGDIKPHLCSSDYSEHDNAPIRFHDDNSSNYISTTDTTTSSTSSPSSSSSSSSEDEEPEKHGPTYDLLAITRTNSFIRSEALPVFYAVNSFTYSDDLPIYFHHLSTLGRSSWIRHITFPIPSYLEPGKDAITLRHVHNTVALVAEWNSAASRAVRTLRGVNAGTAGLMTHPLYRVNSETGILLCLRHLQSTGNNNADDGGSGSGSGKVTLSVPHAEGVAERPGLQWFMRVAKVMGMDVRFMSTETDGKGKCPRVVASWMRRFQKNGNSKHGGQEDEEDKEKKENGGVDMGLLGKKEGIAALKKTLSLAEKDMPLVGKMRREIFYRVHCDRFGGMRWFDRT